MRTIFPDYDLRYSETLYPLENTYPYYQVKLSTCVRVKGIDGKYYLVPCYRDSRQKSRDGILMEIKRFVADCYRIAMCYVIDPDLEHLMEMYALDEDQRPENERLMIKYD